jgi:Lrp/AsnC family leucine-responsive transcriptional regulator
LGVLAYLSAIATDERVQRLQALGVIARFSIEVSAASMGLHMQAFIDVKLKDGTTMAAFESAIARIESVVEANVLTGAYDARLRIACVDPEHLSLLIEELRAATGIQETSSALICRQMDLASSSRSVRKVRLV